MAAAEFDTGGNEGQLKPAAALLAVRKRWCGGAAWSASLRESISIVRGRGDIRLLFHSTDPCSQAVAWRCRIKSGCPGMPGAWPGSSARTSTVPFPFET